ncbi:MAG TPA: LytR C-terminal domain-containing protein [Nocardioidaceae bacterium]|nr:LytR C-terminal domain-containing protein [Nocardioidaceae bacterium]
MSDHFAPDEFDRLDLSTGRRGAHRARPTPLVAALPVVLVLVVVAAVVLGVTTLVGGRDPKSAAIAGFETPSATSTPSTTGSGEPTSKASGTSSGSPSTEPTGSGEPTDRATDTPSGDSTGSQVQQDAPVVVLNGTKTRGLAAKAAQALRDDGWTVSRTDNYRDGQIPTTVFYATPDLEATADKIARQLGGVHVQENAAIGDSITVVLGNDYSG